MKTIKKLFLGFPHISPMGDVLSLSLPAFEDASKTISQWRGHILEFTRVDAVPLSPSIPLDVERFQRTGFIAMPRVINVTCAGCGTTHHELNDLKTIAASGRCSKCVDGHSTSRMS